MSTIFGLGAIAGGGSSTSASQDQFVGRCRQGPFQRALRPSKSKIVAHTTWTLSRETSLGATLLGVTYYDCHCFLVKKSLNLNAADLELNIGVLLLADLCEKKKLIFTKKKQPKIF